MQVWSEPSMVEAGAYEFADTAKFLAAGQPWLPHTCRETVNPLQICIIWLHIASGS